MTGVHTSPWSTIDPVRPVFLPAGRVLAVLAGVAATALQLWHVTTGFGAGEDFVPLRDAAHGLLSGSSVYGDPSFVYPPSAAVPLLITAAGTATFAAQVWAVLSIAGLCVAAGLIAVQAGLSWRLVAGGVSTFALVIGCAANDSLDLGNLSLLLVPVAVAALVAMGRGRWVLGCALLCASLLIKPLLLPMLVVPLLFGRGRELGRAVVPTAIGLALAMILIPGGGHFPHVFAYDLSGTNLHGVNARNNLSIAGWLEAHAVGHDAATALRTLSAIIILAVISAALSRVPRSEVDLVVVAQSGNLVMVGALLVGSISEIHFLVTVLACALLQLAARPSPRAARCLLPGIAMLAVPAPYRDMMIGLSSRQSWYLLAEIALLAGTAATCVGPTKDPVAVHAPGLPVVAVATPVR